MELNTVAFTVNKKFSLIEGSRRSRGECHLSRPCEVRVVCLIGVCCTSSSNVLSRFRVDFQGFPGFAGSCVVAPLEIFSSWDSFTEFSGFCWKLRGSPVRDSQFLGPIPGRGSSNLPLSPRCGVPSSDSCFVGSGEVPRFHQRRNRGAGPRLEL